jgi:polyphosphate kinase
MLQHYINRELSALAFNERVLAQALDEQVPLLERWRFLCISSSNLDEFFEIRVSGLKQLIESGSAQVGLDGAALGDQLVQIHAAAARLVAAQYHCLNQVLLPALQAAGVQVLLPVLHGADVPVSPDTAWDATTRAWAEAYFTTNVEPVLSPLALDPARPFPRIQNKSLNFILQLAGTDAFGRDCDLAVVQAPRSLPRVISVEGGAEHFYVSLATLVEAFAGRLFKGMTVLGCHQFRLTRNSDLFVDEEEVDDLRRALEGELAQRRYGAAVRLETSATCPQSLVEFLCQQFNLGPADCYMAPGPVNLNRLSALYAMVSRPDLKYPAFIASLPPELEGQTDLFAVLRKRDVLLHHPFQSFEPVIGFLRQAAADPEVLAIKQTLYRAGEHSPVVDALVSAAEAGKDVTVIVELRARFDEEANIGLATRLQEAGAHVMYGVVGHKTHAKMSLIVRREGKAIRRYCHLGTGNYHPQTARAYTDYGLLTANKAVGSDVHDIFLQLTGLTQLPKLRQLIQAPFRLHAVIMQLIEREVAAAAAGKPARIVAKMNALVEPEVIESLYRASAAGVKVQLIVRGICALRPGVAGLSENISVRSLVGRFLEHSRAWWFVNGGDDQLLLSSADWMDRNFFRRVEVAFPIRLATLRNRIVGDLERYLLDNSNAWQMHEDGTYTHSPRGPDEHRDAQAELQANYSLPARIPE